MVETLSIHGRKAIGVEIHIKDKYGNAVNTETTPVARQKVHPSQ